MAARDPVGGRRFLSVADGRTAASKAGHLDHVTLRETW
jgi:hypothetical protein